ncbi:hypothetical protein BUALT_Bualt15G0037600 [Buddleja alternifolia]|uniref:Uncharacterized protein n=1 Tax=Buddleja alternifolia TaxID=168488 RepID=A0AAV6WIW8_9LAMI|nr:hypothetical protein BUALT_Bualt15G0037600 [Buddleja alternifolia]
MGKISSRSDEKSRSDRKFEKKVHFYELVRSTVAQKTISKEKQKSKRSQRRKLKAYDLSSLSEYLPELKDPSKPRPAEFKLNSKARNKLVLKEGNQLKTVLPSSFQSDPLAAIYQHLQNTQPASDENLREKIVKQGKPKSKGKSRKRLLNSQWRFNIDLAFFIRLLGTTLSVYLYFTPLSDHSAHGNWNLANEFKFYPENFAGSSAASLMR